MQTSVTCHFVERQAASPVDAHLGCINNPGSCSWLEHWRRYDKIEQVRLHVPFGEVPERPIGPVVAIRHK
jgi:hypothetical protein